MSTRPNKRECGSEKQKIANGKQGTAVDHDFTPGALTGYSMEQWPALGCGL